MNERMNDSQQCIHPRTASDINWLCAREITQNHDDPFVHQEKCTSWELIDLLKYVSVAFSEGSTRYQYLKNNLFENR